MRTPAQHSLYMRRPAKSPFFYLESFLVEDGILLTTEWLIV